MSFSQRGHSFWRWFEVNAGKISQSKHEDEIRLALLDELQKVHSELFYELSVDSVPHELVLTVEGKSDLFGLVKALAALAPDIPNWRIVALKQPTGFSFTTEYGNVALDVARLMFKPLMNRAFSPPKFGLRVGIRDLDLVDVLAAKNAVLVALDTALGEEVAAIEIDRVDVVSLPENFEHDGFLPLPELPAYLEWFKTTCQTPEQ